MIADYVTRHQRGRDETKWYRLDRDGVLYIYGAHKVATFYHFSFTFYYANYKYTNLIQDNLPTHSITLMAYTVQGVR